MTDPTRVMVVVGAAARRTEIVHWLDGERDIAVVAAHRSAAAAGADMERTTPDVLVVDPETAAIGFAELAELATSRPALPILMVRADGSPGNPVSRFGHWDESAVPAAGQAHGSLAAGLVAAIRGLERLEEVEFAPPVAAARRSFAGFIH